MDSFSDIEKDFFARNIHHLAGVDEAGRGPLAGPVVAAAVIFSPDSNLPGIMDSKKCTVAHRERLATEIRNRAISVGVGIVPHERIDQINILHASIEAMHLAIRQLSVTPDLLLVDGNRFYHDAFPFQTIVKGDARCFSIAAASIIAKVTRDDLMIRFDGQYPQYGFSQHKGYPTKQHIDALRRFGPSEIHRKSFTVKALLPQLSLYL